MSENMPKYDPKMSSEEALKIFNVQIAKGLSSSEAQSRLATYGENTLEIKKESLFRKFFSYFWGPIPWMIEIAAFLSALLEKWPDFIVILAMLIINGILGFFQEYKAGNAIEALRKKLALRSRVLRDGTWKEIEAKNLVPGDIIQIKLGNIIPADIKLISGEYISVDQSALTGESLPVDKKLAEDAYSGTIVKQGEMIGLVTSTGIHTFFGKTAQLVEKAKASSHFQEVVMKIGRFLIISTLTICALILSVSLYRLELTHTIHESLGKIIIFILVLVIAGIPIALPAVLSATLAIGANKLAQLKAIVSKLTSIEELASMDILCSDKTGTLTKNQLTVGEIHLFTAKNNNEILFDAALASNIEGNDAIDSAIIEKVSNPEELKKYQKKKFIPFDPSIKRTEATVITPDGKTIILSKGAPQVILTLCAPSKELEQKVQEAITTCASKGYRTLGVARKENDHWNYLGIIPLFDPPRDDTKQTMQHVQNMGVQIKMVTGDHVAIAQELAKNLDMKSNILPVKHLLEENHTTADLEEKIEKADGFAEVFPEHKFNIVKTLQDKKHIVGMTGDGVNDAPALKQADVGIAVSGATDAAKEAADLILTEPGLLVISHAIEEARKIFGRMKSYAMYRITETCRLLLFLGASMMAFNDHPLTAIMIIVIALLNDIPIMMIAYDHMRTHSKPVLWNMKEVLTISIGLAVVGVVSTFGLYWIGDRIWFAAIEDPTTKFYYLRTLAFMGILCGGNLTIYLTRNVGAIWQKPLPEWKFFLSTIVSLTIGTIVAVYGLGTTDFMGIGWKYVAYSWIYILIWFFICMLVKEALYRTIGYDKKRYYEEFLEKTAEKIHLN
ncbi:MAG: plasma-membrane proton-efflux P-type ATPase [Parachlamydiales bacterium]|nr:plasma-membrane proton-efflux P-type ATPase [Parachlamydiales bacterium]